MVRTVDVREQKKTMRVLMITCEWPSPSNPHGVPFIVRQVEFLRKAGVDVDVFAFRGAKNPFRYLRAWFGVHRRIRQGSYDLLHAQWGQSAITALPTRLPLVVTLRGGEGEGLVGRSGNFIALGYFLRAICLFVARRATEVVLVSRHIQQFLPRRRFHVIPSGLDFSKLPLVPQAEARRQLGLPMAKPLVLFVGDPNEARKRYSLARQIVSRLDEELQAELVLAWNVPHHTIPVYMNACDALLFTSMFEGSPNVVKEALACNLPVVSTAVGDVSERLKGVTGCSVFEEVDIAGMADALTAILRRRQRIDGRAAVSELDENLLAQKMIAVYQRALTGGGQTIVGRQWELEESESGPITR
jgi:glycosyltransferase involved in cell wall biosynthesis